MRQILPEMIALGSYDASVVHKNAKNTPPRRVWMYEIELVLEDGGASYINDSVYPVTSGSLIIGKPGQMRHTSLPFKCLYLHVKVEDSELDAALRAMPDVYIPSNNTVTEAFEKLIAIYSFSDTDAGMRTASELCSFLSLLIRDTRLVSGSGMHHKNNSDTIEKALEFMDSHFCENVTLEQIADHVYLSRIYFRNLFLSATGKTPHEYLLKRRLAYAKKLLITTDLSVGAVAQKCGFSSQSYFNQVFKREFGCTPSAYKTQMSLSY